MAGRGHLSKGSVYPGTTMLFRGQWRPYVGSIGREPYVSSILRIFWLYLMNSDVHLKSVWPLLSCPSQTDAVSSIHIGQYRGWGRRQGDAQYLQGDPLGMGSIYLHLQVLLSKPSQKRFTVCPGYQGVWYRCECVCVHTRCPCISPGVM